MTIAASQVVATQLTRLVESQGAFLVMWTHAAQMAVFLPWRRHIVITPRTLAFFLVLFFGANYSYVLALGYAPASYVQAIFGTAPAVVTLLARAWLGELLTARRWAAVFGSIAGVACLAGLERTHNSVVFGVLLAQVAVVNAAIYKVGFKLRFGDPSPRAVLGFLGCLGATAAIAGLPVVLLGTFKMSLSTLFILLGGGFVDVLYNASIALGLALARSPLYIAVATLLAIPASAAVDATLNHLTLTWAQIVGSLFILASFAILAVEQQSKEPVLHDEETISPLAEEES